MTRINRVILTVYIKIPEKQYKIEEVFLEIKHSKFYDVLYSPWRLMSVVS